MAGKLKPGPDAALNSGISITVMTVDGRTIQTRVHEIAWKKLKAHAKDVHNLVIALIEANPSVDWTKIGAKEAVQVVFNSILPMLEGITDLLDGIVADSADLSLEDIDELRVSSYERLLAAVLDQQREAIGDFFGLRDAVRSLVTGDGSSRTTGKSKS